jgi:hypothetical protein
MGVGLVRGYGWVDRLFRSLLGSILCLYSLGVRGVVQVYVTS